MSLYSGFLSSSCMYLIQVFWFVAFGVADRIAKSPLLPISLARVWTRLWPIPSDEAWLIKMLRLSGAVSESSVTTEIFWPVAFFRYGTSALGSLAAIRIAFWRCVIAVLMYGT